MCLAALYWQPQEEIPLKVVANRDEFRNRPAAAMHWWPEHPILAGKDLQAGGTWLGVSKAGKFALLTNIRPGYIGKTGQRSRGELVSSFLASDTSIQTFHRQISSTIDQYGGFNLIIGTAAELFWFSSDHPEGQWLTPGVHALSNDALNTPWPKALLAREQMAEQHFSMATGLSQHTILMSTATAEEKDLPDTGIATAWERTLSSQTILGAEYGTRCRSHIVMTQQGEVRVQEQQLDDCGDEIDRVEYSFQSQPTMLIHG